MNRGSAVPLLGCGEYPVGFNEAPIHESGKSATDRRAVRGDEARFNEAPIHESGKC